jgi:small subunit ribosomal protein S20
MANHKSALKRIRANETKRLRNRYQHKTTRSYIKKLREASDKAVAVEVYKTVSSMLDRLAKKNIIHKKKLLTRNRNWRNWSTDLLLAA